VLLRAAVSLALTVRGETLISASAARVPVKSIVPLRIRRRRH
jgi:hypothetical protein